MRVVRALTLIASCACFSAYANESLIIDSDSGDTLMIHQLKNGEIWGSLMITDQIADSFADHELIVLQVDQYQPVSLDQEKRCNTPAGKPQQVNYTFESEKSDANWLLSEVDVNTSSKSNFLKLTGWDKETYQHMKSDRRPEVVDFPIKASLAIELLANQFQQGERVIFRYTTTNEQPRQAKFELAPVRDELSAFFMQ